MIGDEKTMMPILLRHEAFGGLLFRPEDAVHVELDREAFAFVKEYLSLRREPSNEDESRLLRQVQAQIGDGRFPRARHVCFDTEPARRTFQVLNAPTLADFQITTGCTVGCPQCYASAEPNGVTASPADIEHVFNELAQNGVAQVALGGGEPLEHPELIPILEMCVDRGMVPNLTTNGIHLTPDTLKALKRHCGAVALSMEAVDNEFDRRRKTGFAFFKDRLDLLLKADIPTVIQVTLSLETLPYLSRIVDFCLGRPGLYGVIFLAYKEVGRGRGFDHTLLTLPPRAVFDSLRTAFLKLSEQTRVGYDCCLTPAIVGLESDLSFSQHDRLEGCSALRSSMGILPNLDITPCTFTPELVIGNLGRERLYDIWRKPEAERFRTRFERRIEDDASCGTCSNRLDCLGGCPVFDLVRCQLR